MSTENLEIVIEATVQDGVKGVQTTLKTLNQIPASANKAGASVNKLSLSIEELRAKILARQDFLIKTNDLDKIAKYNKEIEQLSSELVRVSNIGKTGFDEFGNKIEKVGNKVEKTAKQSNALGKGFSFIRQAAYLLPGIGIAGIFNEIGVAVAALVSELAKGSGYFEDMATVIGSSAEEAYKAREKFTGFIDRITDSGTSLKAQKDALKEANKALAEYGIQIDSVSAAQKNGAILSGLYADAKREEAKQLALSALAGKEFAKQAELDFAAKEGSLIDIGKQVGAVNLLKNAFKNFGSVAVGVTGTMGGYADAVGESENKQKFFEQQISRSKTTVEAIIGLMQMFGSKTQEAEKPVKALRQQLEKVDSLVKGGFLGALDSSGSLGKNRIIIELATKFQKDEIRKNFQDLVKFVNELPKPTIKLEMNSQIKEALTEFQKTAEVIKALEATATSGLASAAVQAAAGDLETLKTFVKEYQQQAAILQQVAADSISSVAEGIGNALAGGGNLFGPFLNVLANGLVSLGKYLISISAVIKSIKAALKTAGINDVALIIGGAALVAIGSAIKAKVSSTKFAEGGIVSGPMNAQIGEAGQSEVILPLSRLSGLLSNNRGMVVMETRITGQDLLLVQARASGSRGRTYG